MREYKLTKGSMTVEAAALMPVVLLVIFGCLYLCFFVHNRSWLTAAAYEAAISGSMDGVHKQGQPYDTALTKSKELGSRGFFGAENLTTATSVGSKVQVSYDLDTIANYGGLRWHLSVQGSSRILQPVKRIRQMKSVREIIYSFKGGE